MKIVVDTNVLVSGILSEGGPPGKIVDLIMSGDLQVCFNPKILTEYGSVLNRPELFLSDRRVTSLLAQFALAGEAVAEVVSARKLPDFSDEVFLEAALSGGADCLITGNLRHFPLSCRQGIRVLSPREFLEFYREQQAGGSDKVKSPPTRYKAKRRCSRTKTA